MILQLNNNNHILPSGTLLFGIDGKFEMFCCVGFLANDFFTEGGVVLVDSCDRAFSLAFENSPIS
jgi:hypothetical protein